MSNEQRARNSVSSNQAQSGTKSLGESLIRLPVSLVPHRHDGTLTLELEVDRNELETPGSIDGVKVNTESSSIVEPDHVLGEWANYTHRAMEITGEEIRLY